MLTLGLVQLVACADCERAGAGFFADRSPSNSMTRYRCLKPHVRAIEGACRHMYALSRGAGGFVACHLGSDSYEKANVVSATIGVQHTQLPRQPDIDGRVSTVA